MAREYVRRDAPDKGMTGFDVLMENKALQIQKLEAYVKQHSVVTRVEVMKLLGCSERSASRYLSDVRKRVKFEMGNDGEVPFKQERIRRFRALIQQNKNNPGMTTKQYAKAVGVSSKTLRSYNAELSSVELSMMSHGRSLYNDEMVREKQERIEKLKKIMKEDPFASRTTLCKKMNISRKTLNDYLTIIYGWPRKERAK